MVSNEYVIPNPGRISSSSSDLSDRLERRSLGFLSGLPVHLIQLAVEPIKDPRFFIIAQPPDQEMPSLQIIEDLSDFTFEEQPMKIQHVRAVRPICRTAGGCTIAPAIAYDERNRQNPLILLIGIQRRGSPLQALPLPLAQVEGLQVLVCPVTGLVLTLAGLQHRIWDPSRARN